MLAGLFQILFGYLKIGRYVNLMPYPVISAFMTGIGAILIIMQLDPLLGFPGPSGVLGGIPGAGATIRTLTNIHSGGRTPLSGIVHALVLLVIAVGLGPLVGFIPEAALAGVLIKVGVDVIDWRFLGRAHRAPRSDLVLMIVVFVLTVFVDVITAVGIGIVLASLTFVKQAADVQVESIRAITDPDTATLFDAEEARLFRKCRGSVSATPWRPC